MILKKNWRQRLGNIVTSEEGLPLGSCLTFSAVSAYKRGVLFFDEIM